METCKGCHTGIHSTFIHTGMGLSFDAATKQKSSADFSNHPVVHDQYKIYLIHLSGKMIHSIF